MLLHGTARANAVFQNRSARKMLKGSPFCDQEPHDVSPASPARNRKSKCLEPKHNDQYRHAYGDHWDYDSDGNPQQQRQPIYGDGDDVDAPPELHASSRRWEPNRLTKTTIPTKTAKDDNTLTQPVACFYPVGFVFEAGGRLLFL